MGVPRLSHDSQSDPYLIYNTSYPPQPVFYHEKIVENSNSFKLGAFGEQANKYRNKMLERPNGYIPATMY